MAMRMRSLGLMVAGALVLAASYPSGQAAAQLTNTEQSGLRTQQWLIDRLNDLIAGYERDAQVALANGDCAGYSKARELLGELAGPYTSDLDVHLPDRTRNEIIAQANLVLASLPANCDPDPLIRQSLVNEADPDNNAGGE